MLLGIGFSGLMLTCGRGEYGHSKLRCSAAPRRGPCMVRFGNLITIRAGFLTMRFAESMKRYLPKHIDEKFEG